MKKRRFLTTTLTALLTASLAVPAYARSADVMGLAEGGYETAGAGVSVTQESEYVWPGVGQVYEICVGYGEEDENGDGQPDAAPTEYETLTVTLPDGFELWDVDLGEWTGADGDVTELTVTADGAEYSAEYETQTDGDGNVTGAWALYSYDEWGYEKEEVTDLSALEGGFTVTLPDGGAFVSEGVTGSGNIIGDPLTVTGTFSETTLENRDEELVLSASVSVSSGSAATGDGAYEASVTARRDYYEVGGITVTSSADGSSADISISGVSVKGARPYEDGMFKDITLRVDLGGSAVVSVSSLGGWDGTATVRQPVDSDGEYILSYTTTDSATFTISQAASGRNEITQTEPIVLHVRNSADTAVSYGVTATLGEVRYLVNGGYVDDALGGDSTATGSASFTLDADEQTGSGSGTGSSGSGDTDTGDTGGTDTGSSDTGSGDTGGTDTGDSDTGSGDTGGTDTGDSDTGSGDTGGTDIGSDDGGASGADSSGDGTDADGADDAAGAADADGTDQSDGTETVDLSKLGLTAVKGTATGGSSISLLSVTPTSASGTGTSAADDADDGATSNALDEELTEEEIEDLLESGEITEEEAEELLSEITDEEDEEAEDDEESEEDSEAVTILSGSSYSEDDGSGFFSGGTGSGDGLSILGLDDDDTAIYETPLFWVLVAAAAAAAVLAILLGRQRRVNRGIEQRLSDTSAAKKSGDEPEAAEDATTDGSRSGHKDDIS